jgi:hypothetical protein
MRPVKSGLKQRDNVLAHGALDREPLRPGQQLPVGQISLLGSKRETETKQQAAGVLDRVLVQELAEATHYEI